MENFLEKWAKAIELSTVKNANPLSVFKIYPGGERERERRIEKNMKKRNFA